MVDVGCGLGGSARHLARKYGCSAEGITLSEYQARRGNEISQQHGLMWVEEFPRLIFEDLLRV